MFGNAKNRAAKIGRSLSMALKTEGSLHDMLASRDPSIFAFHGDMIYQGAVLAAIRLVQPKMFIETGTFYGDSTRFIASSLSDLPVLSCEVKHSYFRLAKAALRDYGNVRVFRESSPGFLRRILKELPADQRVMFFLDAHWGRYWPLADELRIITNLPNPFLIVIDDFRSPRDWLHYDRYSGQDLDLRYVATNISSANNYSGFLSDYDRIETKLSGVADAAGHIFLLQNLRNEFERFRETEPFSKSYLALTNALNPSVSDACNGD